MTWRIESLTVHFQLYTLEETDLKQVDSERIKNRGIVEDQLGKFKNAREYNKNNNKYNNKIKMQTKVELKVKSIKIQFFK